MIRRIDAKLMSNQDTTVPFVPIQRASCAILRRAELKKLGVKCCNFIALLVLLVSQIYMTSCYAILDIEITQGVDTAVPIAIYPFSVDTVQPVDKLDSSLDYSVIHRVVSNDLYRSGLFVTKLQQPFEFGLGDQNLSKLPVVALQSQGIEYIIKGSIQKLPYDRYSVSISLLSLFQLVGNNSLDDSSGKLQADAINKAVLLNKTFEVTGKQLRALAHHLSDIVYEQLTGFKGVFSTKIAYVNVVWKDQNTREYILEVADSDGYDPKSLLVSSEPIMSPSWHPNGREIAYVSFLGNRSKIRVIDLNTGNTRTLTSFKGINGAPAWSPDGSRMALVLSNENVPKVYILDLFKEKLNQITFGESIDTEPRWSPKGDSLIFTSNRGGAPQIYQYNFSNKKISRLTFEGNYNARASFTPDGTKLVMIHRSKSESGFNIAVQDLTTYNVDVLTESSMDESPSVSANGQQIIYATKENDRGILAEVSIDGRVKIKRPARVGDVQEPAWSPHLS